MKHLKIYEVRIDAVDYNELLYIIEDTINSNSRIHISYVNANTINTAISKPELIPIINSFDILHPDGIGIYLASKSLLKKKGLRQRFGGSDFYPLLIKESLKQNWSFYFFGHKETTLSKIKIANPGLNISGYSEGYNYVNNNIIDNINKLKPDILIIGLGFPNQEKWIYENKDKLNCKIYMCVGDGIKVFANTKIRGPKFMQKLGLEWLVRVFTNPIKYGKRYLIGNPLFLYRLFKIKVGNLIHK